MEDYKETTFSNFKVIINSFKNYRVILLLFITVFSFLVSYIRKESYFVPIVVFFCFLIDIYLSYIRKKISNKEIFKGNNGKTNPLEKKENQVNRVVCFILLLLILIIMAIGVILKYDFFDVLLISLSLAIAASGVGMNLVITFLLLEGKNKLESNNIKIKQLDRIETFGSMDTLILNEQLLVNSSKDKILEVYTTCQKYGIRIIMILEGMQSEKSIDGTFLDSMEDNELLKVIEEYQSYTNLSTTGKIRIMELLQRLGHVVGILEEEDEVMQKADLAISFEKQMTRNSDCVIDSNLSKVACCIEEGVRVSSNIKRGIVYLLTGSFIEEILIFLSILLNMELFTNMELLWINLIINTTLAMFLAFENKADLLNKRTFFTQFVIFKIIISSLFKALIGFLIFLHYAKIKDILIASSVLFLYIIVIRFLDILSFRNLKESIFNKSIMDNKRLILGLVGLIGFQTIVLLTRFSEYFIVSKIEIKTMGIIMVIGFVVFLIEELIKPLYRKVFKD